MATKKPVRERAVERLPVDLNERELVARGGELAALVADQQKLAQEKASAMTEFKSKLQRVEDRIGTLSAELREGTEMALVVGIVLGVLFAIMYMSPNPVLKNVARFYVWFFRGTPLLLQLLMLSFAELAPK